MSVQLTVTPFGDGGAPADNSAGTIDVSDAFAADFNEPLVHQVVVAYQAGRRSGTRAQKNRAAVSGGGAKPWRQKGTGRARAGTIRSPIFRGGGVTFPASTKDFSQKVNRKMYRAAMRCVLAELHRQQRLIVVDGLAMDKPNTKSLAARLRGLHADKALLVIADEDRNVELSARNLIGVGVAVNARIDPVSLISYDKVVVTVDAVKKIDEALQ